MTSDRNIIIDFVLTKVANLTKTDRTTLHADFLLVDAGVDSLKAVLLCGYLEDEYQLEIEPIVMFEYKTAGEVADALLAMMATA